MCRSSGEIVLLLAARQGVVYLATVNMEVTMENDDVRLLTIQSVSEGTFVLCTFPAPISIIHSVFPESAGIDETFRWSDAAGLLPVPSILMDCDTIVQITTSEEAYACAEYFHKCGAWLELQEYEEDLNEEPFDDDE